MDDRCLIICNEPGLEPCYQTAGSAGADIRAFLPDGPIVLLPGSIAMVPTGIRLAIPEGFEAQVRPRSGLAIKHGITVINSPGTIDSDYRGDVLVGLVNLSSQSYEIHHLDRIAQMVFARYHRMEFKVVDALDQTQRAEGGFGSSGRT